MATRLDEPGGAEPFLSLRRWFDRRRAGPVPSLPEHADAQLHRLLDRAGMAVLGCAADGTVMLANVAAGRLLGCARPAGRRLQEWLAGDDAAALRVPGPHETVLQRPDGSRFPAELTVGESREESDALRVIIVRDITDRRLTQERLTLLANYDGLTGLPNRSLFRDRLAHAMAQAAGGATMALMFLDLDNFKVVNDSLGHDAGDTLLRRVAATLQRCLKGDGGAFDPVVARLGGDEFTVILPAIGSAEDAAVAAQRILDALDEPFQIRETEVHVSASIGITMYAGERVDLDELLRRTDMAMYRSKLRGRNTYSFFSAEMGAEAAARLHMESDLRHALERREFVLHYQPKADLGSGEITGVEALLRWRCPQRGLITPDRFIPVLEDSGLILPVGAWVLRQALEDLASWDGAGLPRLCMAVNLSARQFGQAGLARFVTGALQDAGIDPRRLELELTESLLLEDSDASRDLLAAFARLGVRVAMDDFGTGHSSLAYLKRFDIDTLKIDRSFVAELPEGKEDAAIAAAIIAMGRTLQMKVVAEGVETEAQARYLAGAGCDEVQGWLVSRPLHATALAAWLRARCDAQQRRRRHARRDAGSGDTWPMTLMSIEGT